MIGNRHTQLAGIAGIVLLVDMFLSWYSINVPGGSIAESLVHRAGIDTTATAWQAFSTLDIYLFVTAVVAIVAGFAAELVPFPALRAATGLGAVAAVLILYRIINQPGPNKLIDVKYGAFIGLLAAIGIAVEGSRAGTSSA